MKTTRRARASAGAFKPELPPIRTMRAQRVVLDSDLAALYGVTTKVFNQTIRRNADRFPGDFAFQLTRQEVANLRSQFVTSSSEPSTALHPGEIHGGRRYLPWVFTEHGAILAATLLRSPRAVALSVFVVRAFLRMRDEVLTHAALARRLESIDRKLLEPDSTLRELVEKVLPLLREIPEEPVPPKRPIGFHGVH